MLEVTILDVTVVRVGSESSSVRLVHHDHLVSRERESIDVQSRDKHEETGSTVFKVESGTQAPKKSWLRQMT